MGFCLPILGAAAIVAASALAAGASPAPAVCAGVASALWSGVILRNTVARRRRFYDRPLGEAVEVLEVLRSGHSATQSRLADAGAPSVRALVRRINDLLATSQERARSWEARQLSDEVALDRLHSLLQSLQSALLVVDPIGVVVLANEAGLRLAGVGQVTGEQSVRELLPDGIREEVLSCLADAEAGESGTAHRNGAWVGDRAFDLWVVRVRSRRTGEDFGYAVVLEDVTERFAAARAKEDFLSSVSHELRTPLTNICAFAEILAQSPELEPEEEQEFVGVIQAESQRLSRLVDNVLDYAQLDAQHAIPARDPVDAVQLLLDSWEMFTPAAQKRQVTIEVRGELDAPVVLGDRARLQQVFANLFDNGIKFCADGGRLRVTLTEDSDQLCFAFEDDGPGVRPEDRERIFDSMTQLGDTLTEKPAGTGLGLTLCRKVLDQMGGSLVCAAAPAPLGGACFLLHLPKAPQPAESRG